MAAPKRTIVQRERDLIEVAHLYCAGRRQVEIAAKLGVSQQQVSYDVQSLLREWRAGHRADIDRYVGERVPISGRARGETPDVRHDRLAGEVKHRRSTLGVAHYRPRAGPRRRPGRIRCWWRSSTGTAGGTPMTWLYYGSRISPHGSGR